MFNIVDELINKTLFPWFNSSNATHNVLVGAIGSILGTIILSIATWLILRSRDYVRGVFIDENLKTRHYLKSLEQRARISVYWQSAGAAQRIHFVVLRVSLILCMAVAVLACQSFQIFGAIMKTSQENMPRNVVSLINATKQTTDGLGVALIEQQYVVPVVLLLCLMAITILFAALSAVIYVLKTIRLAEFDNHEQLLQAINSIRVSMKFRPLLKDDPILKPRNSLLYPL